MYGNFRKNRGFSLVETLVAITILLIAVLAPMRIASQSIKTAGFAREQLTAVFLAQEGIESVLHLRDSDALDGDESWDWFDDLEDAGCADAGCSYNFVSDSFVNCATIGNCLLYFDEDASNGVYYTHNAGSLPASAFTRVVKVTEIDPGKEVEVISTVQWESLLVKGTIDVTARTRVFNQYEPDN